MHAPRNQADTFRATPTPMDPRAKGFTEEEQDERQQQHFQVIAIGKDHDAAAVDDEGDDAGRFKLQPNVTPMIRR